MPPPSVTEAVAWSRNAEALVALLQQATVVPPPVLPQNSTVPPEAFEVASIRPTRFAAGGGERGGGSGGQASPRPGGEPCGSTGSRFLEFDPKRVAISDMTLYGLIAWAYELPCRPWVGSHVLVGGQRMSVVGTVFLVNAGDDGSRVAVIEGEVRVQQGAAEKKRCVLANR